MTRSRRRGRDRGSGTLLGIGVAAGGVALALAVIAAASLCTASVRIQGVADAAAIAGASEWRDSSALGRADAVSRACGRAREVAQRNGVRMNTCRERRDHRGVSVEVTATAAGIAVTRSSSAGTG